MNRLLFKCPWVYLLPLLMVLPGCDAPDVSIIISPEYQSAAIQVDFVKVERSEVSNWLGMNIDEYFSPGSQMREFAKERGEVHTVYYNVPGKAFQGQIPSNDPVWETIEIESGSEQSYDVVVLVDLPGNYAGAPQDIRRTVIPLQKKAWSFSFFQKALLNRKLNKLSITITSKGIVLFPAPVEK